MEREDATKLNKATGLCDRLYNFFVRHFVSQGARLVTLGPRAAMEEDFHPVATIPVEDGHASSAWGGKVRIGGREELGGAPGKRRAAGPVKPILRAPSNINERSDAFIRSKKEALRSESGHRRSPNRQ